MTQRRGTLGVGGITMLIDSKFHDYYDSITSFGIDKTVVYKRWTEEIPAIALRLPKEFPFEAFPNEEERRHRGRNYKYRIHCFVLGFCGKLYPGVTVAKYDQKGKSSLREYFFGKDSLRAFLEREKIKSGHLFRYSHRRRWTHRRLNYDEDVDQYFESNAFDDLKKQFVLRKTPVFLFGPDPESEGFNPRTVTLKLNPCLKTLCFMRVKPPVVAFQEIYMYLTGVLGVPDRPTVQISDAKLAEKKGHGGKYSFRRPPREKK